MPGNPETATEYAARLDAEDQAFAVHMQGLREQHESNQMLETLQSARPASVTGVPFTGASPEASAAVLKRVVKLPKDVGIAVWDTVRNSTEMLFDLGAALADVDLPRLKAGEGVHAFHSLRGDGQQGEPGDSGQPGSLGAVDVDLRDIDPEFIDAVDQVRARLGAGDNGFDIAAQKLFQFVGPFAGAMHVMGGLSKAPGAASWLANTGKAGLSDAITSYTVFDPHEARFADLLREYAPDNRLVNAYIDYAMSDPADSDAEGRWKNAVDNTLFGLGAAGVGAAIHSAVRGAVYFGGKALSAARGGQPFHDMAMQIPVSEGYQQYEKQLTPETRAELHAMRADAEDYQPAYKTTLEGIAQEVTGDAKNALVADIKGWDSIARKVVGEEDGRASGVRDFVRGTILVKNREELEKAWGEISQRFPQARGTSSRTSLLDGTVDSLGYSDMKLNIAGPNGRVYEIQVTTPELWAAKNGEGHKFYEQWRDIRAKAKDRDLTVAEQQQLAQIEAESRAYYAAAFDRAAFFGGKPLSSRTPVSNRLKDPSGSSSKAPE